MEGPNLVRPPAPTSGPRPKGPFGAIALSGRGAWLARMSRRFTPLLCFRCLGLALILAGSLRAQTQGAGACGLIISYKAAPQDRPALRAFMEQKGVAQFERWRHEGVFARYQILLSTFANQDLNDLTVILQFDHFADVAKWSQVEREAAGGLATPEHFPAVPVQTDLVDLYRSGAAASRDPAKAICLVIPYTVPGSLDEYRRYVDGYVIPQMEGWIRHGVISAYAVYINQNGAGAKWDALIIQEYNGYDGLAQREILKDQVRGELASNPTWKQWSQNKTHIRTEGHANLTEPILAAQPPSP